jgi:Spy/CpxP family protein refolding chaperone
VNQRKALLLVLVFASLSLIAQSSGMPAGHQMLANPDKFADGHLAALDRQLHLTDDQKTKLRPVFFDEGKKLFAVLNSTTLSQEEVQAAIGKLHAETAAKVDSLLTPEQRRQMTPAGQHNAAPASQT